MWNKEQFKKAREKAGLSVKGASVKLDISDVYLSYIEHGHRNPSNKLVDKMSKLYDTPINYFFDQQKIFASS